MKIELFLFLGHNIAVFIDLSNKFQDKQKSWNFIGKKIRENRNKKFWSEPPADSDFKK